MISRRREDIETVRDLIRRTKNGDIMWIGLSYLMESVKAGEADENTSELLSIYSHNMQRQRHIPHRDSSFVTLFNNDVFFLSNSKYSDIVRLDRYSESQKRWYVYNVYQPELIRLLNIIGFKGQDIGKQEERSTSGTRV